MGTSCEGKEMDELVADLKRKFEPSQQHVKSVGKEEERVV